MSKIDISTVYRDRVEQIEKDMKKAKKYKKWPIFYKLRAEKERLEQKNKEFKIKKL
ncbi:hypothetical protein HYI19_18085 [Clostridium botulinum]|uniref:hypothetical protein n=1 Tax=Clostridium botulinum TaxID=1491 RepID=UPI001C9ACABC|nr:hypothetical protein [Clostridium botulinum]MBY6846704.1 hypothetical protein [Clostridium botulinum]